MKRILALLLAVFCAFVVLTACGADKDKNNDKDDSNQTDSLTKQEKQLNEGIDYLQKHEYEKAVDTFAKIIEKDEKCVEAHVKCGDAYYGWGRQTGEVEKFEKALECYETAYSIDVSVEDEVARSVKECYKEIASISGDDYIDAFECVMIVGDVDTENMQTLLTQRSFMWKIEDYNEYLAFFDDGTMKVYATDYTDVVAAHPYKVDGNSVSVTYPDGYVMTWEFDKSSMNMMYDTETVELVDAEDVFRQWDVTADKEFEDSIQTASSQAAMNSSAADYFNSRELLTNELLYYLEGAMSESEYEKLLTEHSDWEEDMKAHQKEAASQYEGGSMYPLEYACVGAGEHKLRYAQLLTYLK